jgi:hypothetical protein
VIKKKAYLQYNNETTHVARAGILYIYPESSENSGLSDNINVYISPIDRVNLKPLYGLEYSYEMKNGLSFMLAGGKIGESNDERSMIAGFNYETGNFNAGAIINDITATDSDAKRAKYTPAEKILGERLSVMVPLEYNFNYGYLNMTGVYEENENLKNTEYKALEASVTMPVFESGSVRLIHTTDNEHQKGYALRYAHILYDHIFLNTNFAKINTKTSKLESVSIGLNLIY